MNADINIVDNMGNNIYMIALQYKRDISLFYLLDNEFKKTYIVKWKPFQKNLKLKLK